jgi:hypothetical protein
VLFYLIFNFPNIFDFSLSQFTARKDYSVDYSQGSGNINLRFFFTHLRDDGYSGQLHFKTSCSGVVEDFGIAHFNFSVYRDEIFQESHQKILNGSTIYYSYHFYLYEIYEDHDIRCEGNVNAQFNIEGAIQSETISFEINVRVPKNILKRRYDLTLALPWVLFFFIVSEVTVIGFIINISAKLKRAHRYSEEDKKRDKAFRDFFNKKHEELER